MTKNCYCRLQNKKEFFKWIAELLAPVLLGVKPAEILSFPSSKIDDNNPLSSIEEIFERSNKISYKVFYTPNRCMKVLFYNMQSLDNTLKDKRNLRFLKSIGYPEDFQWERYLDLMIDKVKSGQMPHEIGTFLGYPLKDVLGFIGHPSLKLTKVNGWRIYGDPKVSDLKCQQILEAKQKIKQQLENIDISYILESAS